MSAELEDVVARFRADISDFSARLDELGKKNEDTGKWVEETWADVGKEIQSAGKEWSLFITAPLTGAAAFVLKQADEMIQAQAQLKNAIAAAGGSVDDELPKFRAFAEAIQEITTSDDDDIVALVARARALGLSAQESARAAKNAVALSAAYGVNQQSAIRMTAALEAGNTTMLSRFLPTLRAIKDPTERAAAAQTLLEHAFGAATAQAQAGFGPLKQLYNELKELGEQFGVLIFNAVNPFILKAREVVRAFEELSPHTRTVALEIAAVAAAIGPGLVAFGTMVRVLSFAGKGLLEFARVTAFVAGAVVRGMFQLVSAILSGPGLIATAVVGLAAVGIVFRQTLTGIFSGLGAIVHKLWVNEIVRPIMLELGFLRDALPAQAQGIFDDLFGEVKIPPSVADDVENTFTGVFASAAEQAGKDVETLKSELAGLGDLIKSQLPPDLVKLFETLTGGFNDTGHEVKDTKDEIDDLINSLSNVGGAAATRGLDEVRAKFKALRESVRTPQEELADTLNELAALELQMKKLGLTTDETAATFVRARDAAGKKYLDALRKDDQAAQDLQQQLTSLATSASTGFEDAVIGGEKFGTILTSLAQDAERVAFRLLVTLPLMRAFGSFLTGGGAGAAAGGGFASGAAFAGGRVTPFARGGIVRSPTLFPMANGAGLMGEAGPEAVLPLQRTSGGRLGVAAVNGGADTGTVVNVYAPPGSSVSQSRGRVGGQEQIDVIIDKTVAGLLDRPGSRTHRVMRQTFGAAVQTAPR